MQGESELLDQFDEETEECREAYKQSDLGTLRGAMGRLSKTIRELSELESEELPKRLRQTASEQRTWSDALAVQKDRPGGHSSEVSAS